MGTLKRSELVCVVLAMACVVGTAVAGTACFNNYQPSCCTVAVGAQPVMDRLCGGNACPDFICPGGNPTIKDVFATHPGRVSFSPMGPPGEQWLNKCEWCSSTCGGTGGLTCFPCTGCTPANYHASNCYWWQASGAICP